MDLLSKKYRQAEEISNLKAEIKRLKECNEELTADNLNTIQEMDNERRRVEQLKEVNEKLQEILQEIKAIVKNVCHGCTSECDCDEDCNYFLITEALTKAESEG